MPKGPTALALRIHDNGETRGPGREFEGVRHCFARIALGAAATKTRLIAGRKHRNRQPSGGEIRPLEVAL